MSLSRLSMDEAISIIDPCLLTQWPSGMVTELLGVAQGKRHGSIHDLSERQLALARKHRVLPLIPKEWSENQESDYERVRIAALTLTLERSWSALRDSLGVHQDSVRLLKGMATGALDYSAPGLRHTGDIDLLVRPELLADVVTRLTKAGYRQGPHHDTRRLPMEKGVTLIDRNGVEIDLHSRLSWKLSTAGNELFEDPEPIVSNGALAMPAHLRLVHASLHLTASLPGTRRLSGCADIAVLMNSLQNLNDVRAAATRLGVAGLCGAGLQIVANALGSEQRWSDLSDWPAATPLDRAAFLRPRRVSILDRAARMMDLPEPSQKALYARTVLIPQKDTVAAHGGWTGHLRRSLLGRPEDS